VTTVEAADVVCSVHGQAPGACGTCCDQLRAQLAEARAEVERLREDVACYLTDRGDQYETKSPCWIALTDAAAAIISGEADVASAHGEFDETLRQRVRRWNRKEPTP
jgi:hypothetical protein